MLLSQPLGSSSLPGQVRVGVWFWLVFVWPTRSFWLAAADESTDVHFDNFFYQDLDSFCSRSLFSHVLGWDFGYWIFDLVRCHWIKNEHFFLGPFRRAFRLRYISGPKYCCYEWAIGYDFSGSNLIIEDIAATAAACQRVKINSTLILV